MALNQTDVMLAILGLLLMGVGYLGAIVTSIILLIAAFKKSIGWGLASLFLGLPLLIFCIMNFNEVKKPFLLNIGCVVLAILGLIIAAVGAPSSDPGSDIAPADPTSMMLEGAKVKIEYVA